MWVIHLFLPMHVLQNRSLIMCLAKLNPGIWSYLMVLWIVLVSKGNEPWEGPVVVTSTYQIESTQKPRFGRG